MQADPEQPSDQPDRTPPAEQAEGGASQDKLATEVWQPRKVFEMNVYLLRNTGLDLQRWFEREVQALKGPSLRGRHAC